MRKLLLAFFIGLILFWLISTFGKYMIKKEFYTNAALIVGILGSVIVYLMPNSKGKKTKSSE